MFNLQDKRILITGGSSGIGRQIAIHAAENGAIVTILGRDKKRLSDVFTELAGKGHNFFALNLTNEQEVTTFIKSQNTFDGVVFNAGIVEYSPVKFLTNEKIKTVFDINFNSTVILSQQLLKNKLIEKKGSLVFISSIASVIGIGGTALYAASKAALNAYTKVIATETAAQGIRANSISPGIVITPMTEQSINVSTDRSMDDKEKEYPLGYGKPEDVSALAVYLLSNASKWMTGSNLIIDGGLTLT
ncbi:SDR family NAD(P)-dependent oxidoreductase [Mucilaginibacter boryungensis]|uniref:SDR family oxidoreductase n=1 Tax=Mucilaginibacter boryungensis TaxID=768480 RepID=A0ABR9XEN5_9SPHI|nr:SDR family oxidoreductase [Mucilaginibacter boryungensis]MBE9665849.1 SDR family oxidoreductase [Mucilaginibacter boryungensis]